ncbi:LuxR C-terminal-related transcriptional regulator [Gracilibacillus sp. Marseille-QA3620]
MSKSLTNHMNTLLSKAIKLMAEYEDELLAEWNGVKDDLGEVNDRYIETCAFIIDRLGAYMMVNRYGVEATSILSRMREDALEYFAYQPAAEKIIHILNLLENATHTVLKEHIEFSSKLHPSIHYLFTKLSEVLVNLDTEDEMNLDKMCESLIQNANLKIEWIVRVEEQPDCFSIKKIHGKKETLRENCFPTWYDVLNAFGIDHSTLPITYENELLLIGCENGFLHESMSMLFSLIDQHEKSYSTQWKDAVILFNEWIIKSQTLEQSCENICFGFGEFLPFERSALFRFSNMEQIAVGLYAHHLDKEEVKAIREQMIDIPAIQHKLNLLKPVGHTMRNFQPIYIEDAAFGFPEKVVKQFNLASLLIVPIYVPEEGQMIGGVLLDQGPGKHFPVDRTLFPALMKFGQSAGELMLRYMKPDYVKGDLEAGDELSFSPREIEVIKLLAEGASTTEAAVKLYLSEYTVRDYISTIMKRLNAKNRTEVAVKSIRMGIID